MSENMQKINNPIELVNYIHNSLRKGTLSYNSFSWIEVSLTVDCFLKMQNYLPLLMSWEEKDIAFKLIDLYNFEFRNDIDKRFEIQNSFSCPSFESLISSLYEKRVLKKTVCCIVKEITYLRTLEDKSVDSIGKNKGTTIDEFLNELYKDFSSCKNLTSNEEYTIVRNSKKEFFSLPKTSMKLVNLELLEQYVDKKDTLKKISRLEGAACVWPFSCGFARILSKDGKWGYVREEDNLTIWLGDKILYAYDFICERAKVVYAGLKPNCSFIGLTLNNISNKRYYNSSEFNNGYALVSDDYCDDYLIDIWGNVAEKDKIKYNDAKNNKLNNNNYSHNYIRKRRIYDPESDIMNSLEGFGADPELFGF